MSDQRILGYQVVLLENPGLTISPYEVLNPATLLPTPVSPVNGEGALGRARRQGYLWGLVKGDRGWLG